jgi:hypothetical protein
MAAGLNLNEPPSEGDEEDGLLDLNEVPTIGVQQQFEADVHGGGSQDNFPFDLNLLQPEEEQIQTGQIFFFKMKHAFILPFLVCEQK